MLQAQPRPDGKIATANAPRFRANRSQASADRRWFSVKPARTATRLRPALDILWRAVHDSEKNMMIHRSARQRRYDLQKLERARAARSREIEHAWIAGKCFAAECTRRLRRSGSAHLLGKRRAELGGGNCCFRFVLKIKKHPSLLIAEPDLFRASLKVERFFWRSFPGVCSTLKVFPRRFPAR